MPRRSNDVLTVEEMAEVIGVGRQSAYAQCRLYLATDGGEGVPCHRIGRLIRIYRVELEGWLGFPVDLSGALDTALAPTPTGTQPVPTPTQPVPTPTAEPRPRVKRRPRRVVAEQATLPF